MKKRAFTLIELLVVISIISLLASVVLAALNSARDKGKLSGGKQFSANLFHVAAEQAIGLYELSECSGTTTVDRSGNGYTVTLSGSPSWPSDNPNGTGCSLGLNGSSQYGALTTSAFDRTSGQEFSVSAWVKPSRLGGQYQGIAGSRLAGNLNWYLYQHTTDGSIQLHGTSQYKSTYIPVVGAWTHIAAVVDASGVSKLYANGNLVFTTSGYSFGPAAGQFVLGAWAPSAEFFQGNIDEVRVFGKSLTALEVEQAYIAEAPKHGRGIQVANLK